MRVIGGSARGRKLQSPPRPKASGRPGVRPTSDLIRGVIFDMLDAMGASYDRILDLYAGSGALGVEALSRGEGTADFVESDPGSAATIAANLAVTGFESRGKLHRLTAERATDRLSGPYTLVLADPPYYDEGAPEVVGRLAASPLVDEQTVFVLEHHRRRPVPDELGPLRLYRSRRHGDTVVSIYSGRE
ncbi:MAG: 16S rRNA (guanine(966)-N(2))-methyltransferase RsmD [Dehalococcoidia bacterium]|nr:MAG: 16S rRNA (guanine(966)-N(2))-methyltransferase RsmD [Dehalococcoidia bacterium]